MKRKQIILISLVGLIIVAAIFGGVWYSTPKTFLNGLDASDVLSISVFDGNTGKGFTIEVPEEIEQITGNIQGIEMKRDNVSVGYIGYSFSMCFMGKNEKLIDSFFINGPDCIRDDPFFYRCDGGLCFDYLKELEDIYAR